MEKENNDGCFLIEKLSLHCLLNDLYKKSLQEGSDLLFKMHSDGSFWKPVLEDNCVEFYKKEEIKEKEDQENYLSLTDIMNEKNNMYNSDLNLFINLIKLIQEEFSSHSYDYSFLLGMDKDKKKEVIDNYGLNLRYELEKTIVNSIYTKKIIGNNIIAFKQKRIPGNNKKYYNDNELWTIVDNENKCNGLFRVVFYIKKDQNEPIDNFLYIAIHYLTPDNRKKGYTKLLMDNLLLQIKEKDNLGEKINYIQFQTKNEKLVDRSKLWAKENNFQVEISPKDMKTYQIFIIKILL